MKKRTKAIVDGNEAAAYIAHKTNEVIAIYPITPSSSMGELSDAWSTLGQKNIWGTVPSVIEMQSEGGAAGTVHGALQTGALTTTFTASQGLLLMIPNMYKIAGELTPTVFHVSARTVASHALSIFGDHSDVMAVRQTGFAMLCSNSVQEVMDFALISQSATLKTRVPFLHFFDGFRTSHEVMKIDLISETDIRKMIDDAKVVSHRKRGLNPNSPVIRGTAHNPDTWFQARERINPYYSAVPNIVQDEMNRLARLTGRQYKLFDYTGHPKADRIIILMGSGAETAQELVNHYAKSGEKVGVLKVRLFRPFSGRGLLDAIPKTVEKIAVMDRTKEPGSTGEPLYQDVLTAFVENKNVIPKIVGGRYGLSSKEFTPAMVKGVFDELKKENPKNHFTVGIVDDVSRTSLDYEPRYNIENEQVYRGIFYGLGADGTVGANKNSIKIIGEETENCAQGYFVYDSKKSGSVTVSHLRFGAQQIQSTYLIDKANFVAVHNFEFIKTMNPLDKLMSGGTLLLNSPFEKNTLWGNLPQKIQKQILDKNINVYNINAVRVAQETELGVRINTIMQTCFFAISGILPIEEAIFKIKKTINKTYGKKGDEIVKKNYNAVDETLKHLAKINPPNKTTGKHVDIKIVSDSAPEFVKNVTAKIMVGAGDDLPVSAFPEDGTWPTGTTQWEKRNIASEIPAWDPDVCIQCNKCALVCPHGVIRPKIYDKSHLNEAPQTFKSFGAKGREWNENEVYTLQVAPEDCTGCAICVDVCPAKNKSNTSLKAINMMPHRSLWNQERDNWSFFLSLPEVDRSRVKAETPRGSQLFQPLFEFSGACTGCGETPYVKLVSQLFGDRMVVANATGCSSIYGGNLPTTPWSKNNKGLGPAWSNSLFEDNAEFGLGFRMAIDKHRDHARELLEELKPMLEKQLADEILLKKQFTEVEIFEQRERINKLNQQLKKIKDSKAKLLLSISDNLVKKSVWIVGGDGWAYDIGFGGLDHVLASGKDINVLVLDTEVYSNTGGQASKSTPIGAVAKFAASGKDQGKKNLGMIAMSYGNVYVARVAMGANDTQTVRAFIEAEAHPGPSIIIAYSHCIAHGINMVHGMRQQAAAVNSGHWTLYRFNPALKSKGENPFILDCKKPKISMDEYIYNENRYKMLIKTKPHRAKQLLDRAKKEAHARFDYFKKLSETEQDNRPKEVE